MFQNFLEVYSVRSATFGGNFIADLSKFKLSPI
jgi:hypothetical protein